VAGEQQGAPIALKALPEAIDADRELRPNPSIKGDLVLSGWHAHLLERR
jgi:hypothetical protein